MKLVDKILAAIDAVLGEMPPSEPRITLVRQHPVREGQWINRSNS